MQDLARARIVLVTRKTPVELLVERHGTWEQARFYLSSRGQPTEWHVEAHERFQAGFARVMAELPADRRRVRVDRGTLDRFLFAPDDLVVIVGQDGLVPNVAKYLDGQRAVGVNPDPERYDGVLCRHPPGAFRPVLDWLDTGSGAYRLERRTMARAEREDGQVLLSLNEVFVGHRTHQSARYRIRTGDTEERHSSSGFLCATGTGATGWARSIIEQRQIDDLVPEPEDATLVWFVREPFPSVASGTGLDYGRVEGDGFVELVSEMGEDGVTFADGIEADFVEFTTGQRIRVSIADRRLNLVVPA